MIVLHFLLGVCCYMGFSFVAQQKGDFLYQKTDSTFTLIFIKKNLIKIGGKAYKLFKKNKYNKKEVF